MIPDGQRDQRRGQIAARRLAQHGGALRVDAHFVRVRAQIIHRIGAVLIQIDQLIAGLLSIAAHEPVIDAGAQAAAPGIAPRQKAEIIARPFILIGKHLPARPAAAMHEHKQRIPPRRVIIPRIIQADA